MLILIIMRSDFYGSDTKSKIVPIHSFQKKKEGYAGGYLQYGPIQKDDQVF